MISYTCDNCGAVAIAWNGQVPTGWYALTISAQAPPAKDGEGNTMPPGPPDIHIEHADKVECYNAMIAARGQPPIKR